MNLELLLIAFGFDKLTPEDGHAKHPVASATGDSVWELPELDVWFQGVPDIKQLKYALFHAGVKRGESLARKEMRQALGLKETP